MEQIDGSPLLTYIDIGLPSALCYCVYFVFEKKLAINSVFYWRIMDFSTGVLQTAQPEN